MPVTVASDEGVLKTTVIGRVAILQMCMEAAAEVSIIAVLSLFPEWIEHKVCSVSTYSSVVVP